MLLCFSPPDKFDPIYPKENIRSAGVWWVTIKLNLQCLLLKPKGQLISKGLFGILNFSKKRAKKIYLATMIPLFVHFLEELKTPKRQLEINWPLISIILITLWFFFSVNQYCTKCCTRKCSWLTMQWQRLTTWSMDALKMVKSRKFLLSILLCDYC